jgi:hypothetical protein
MSKDHLKSYYNHFELLHDSQVKTIKLVENNLHIQLLDIQIIEYSDAVAKLTNSTIQNDDYTLTINFNNVSFFRLYKLSYKGFLKRIKKQKIVLEEYLYDSILNIYSNTIEIGIVFL